jgi:hypothetical protein
MMPKHEDVLCPTCGGYVKVGGERTTHYYIPVPDPKWKPLMEAAGKVDKKVLLDFLSVVDTYVTPRIWSSLEPLIDALPDKGE